MKRLPNKKVIILVVTLLFVVVAVLWYVGDSNKRKTQAKELELYNKVLTEQKNLGTITGEALRDGDGLETLQRINVPSYSPIIASTSSPETLKKYGQDLALAMSPLNQQREDEVQTMLRALDNKDPNEVKKLFGSRVAYENTAMSLKKITVPETAAKLQSDLVFTVDSIAQTIKNMEKILQEPVLALQSGKVLNTEKPRLLKNLEALNKFFSQNKISFSRSAQLSI